MPKMIALKVVLILSAALILSGCGRQTAGTDTPGPDEIATIAYQTVVAELTRIAGEATPTPTQLPPTETAIPTDTPEPTEAPTLEPTATFTPLAPTSTPNTGPSPTAVLCDRAVLVGDLEVLAGSSFKPGANFTKTWRLRNTGTCTWTKNYSLVWVSGDKLDGPASQNLTRDVRPGETLDLAVDLEAPSTVGEYQGDWKLTNASGARFGIGSNGDEPFAVRIKVSNLNKVVYDFIGEVCDAAWRNDDVSIPCPANENDPEGFMLVVANPTLENGTLENEPALVLHPRAITDGQIRGRYPAFAVKAGDHFQTVIGCLDGYPDCDVKILLRYRIGGGDVRTFREWTEKFNGKITRVDLDLTSLAGQDVQFILSVRANGAPDDDFAFWLGPRIVR